MKSFIGFILFIWLFVMIRKLIKKKSSSDSASEYNFLSRFKKISVSQKVFVSCILLFDVLVIIMSIQDYYFLFLKPTGFIIPLFLIYIAFCVLASGLKLEKFWVILVTALVLPALGLMLFFHSVDHPSYSTIESPSREKILIIEYRDATLGETNHFYTFYSKTTFPFVMKKINNDPVRIVTRGINGDNLEVLGVQNADWANGESVTFRSAYAETKVEWKK